MLDDDAVGVDLILAEVGEVIGADARLGAVVVGDLVGELIGHLHCLAEDEGVGIEGIAPAEKLPFHRGWLAEFLVGQLCVCPAREGT